MQVIFLKKFSRDLDKIKQPKDKKMILELIRTVQSVRSIDEIPNVKRLTGFRDAYRIRLGSLRIGVFVEKNTLEFARVAYCKDIYKIFP